MRSASPSSVTTYTWDPLGHLSQVAGEDLDATYEYGISGMREAKTVVSAEGTSTTKSVWAGMQLVAELDSDGTRYEYVYGGGIPLELIVTEGSNTTGGGTTTRYAYQVDAGGSVIGITDENGDEVARYAYDPYGVPTATSGTDPMAARNPLRYRGYYYDTETGMYYLPARYYQPRSARFLSVDPAPPKAGDPTSLNAHSYCLGDPVNRTDPTGAVLVEFYRADEQMALGGGDLEQGRAKVQASRQDYSGMGGVKYRPPAKPAAVLAWEEELRAWMAEMPPDHLARAEAGIEFAGWGYSYAGNGEAAGWDVDAQVHMASTRCLTCHWYENPYGEMPHYYGSVKLAGHGTRLVSVVGMDQAGGSVELVPPTAMKAGDIPISKYYRGRLAWVTVYVNGESIRTR